MSYASTVSSAVRVTERISNVVTLPIEDYKGIVGFAKRCNEYVQECSSRVSLYEQYEVTASKQIEELTKYAASLEAEAATDKPNRWMVFGVSLVTGILIGVTVK